MIFHKKVRVLIQKNKTKSTRVIIEQVRAYIAKFIPWRYTIKIL